MTNVDTDDDAQLDQAEIERRAWRQGWRPLDQFSGDPKDWKDAQTFLDAANELMPMMRRQNENLNRQVTRLEQDMSGLKQTMETSTRSQTELLETFRQNATDAHQRGYDQALRDNADALKRARQEGDEAKTDELLQQRDDIHKQRQQSPLMRSSTQQTPAAQQQTPAPVQPQQTNPTAAAWETAPEREWFRSNLALREVAVQRHRELLQSNPGLTTEENLEEVDAYVREKFPEKFTRPSRLRNGADDPPPRRPAPPAPRNSTVREPTGSRQQRQSSGREFKDLPPEAKEAFARTRDQLARAMPNAAPFTEKQYCETYPWED